MGQARLRKQGVKLPVLALPVTLVWNLKPEITTVIDETHAKMRRLDRDVPASRSDFMLGVFMQGLNRLLGNLAAVEAKNRLVLTPAEAMAEAKVTEGEMQRYQGRRTQ